MVCSKPRMDSGDGHLHHHKARVQILGSTEKTVCPVLVHRLWYLAVCQLMGMKLGMTSHWAGARAKQKTRNRLRGLRFGGAPDRT